MLGIYSGSSGVGGLFAQSRLQSERFEPRKAKTVVVLVKDLPRDRRLAEMNDSSEEEPNSNVADLPLTPLCGSPSVACKRLVQDREIRGPVRSGASFAHQPRAVPGRPHPEPTYAVEERPITRWEYEHVVEEVQTRLDSNPDAMLRICASSTSKFPSGRCWKQESANMRDFDTIRVAARLFKSGGPPFRSALFRLLAKWRLRRFPFAGRSHGHQAPLRGNLRRRAASSCVVERRKKSWVLVEAHCFGCLEYHCHSFS